MNQRRKQVERNGHAKGNLSSVWVRAFTPNSEWPDKDEFLDVLYWSRQILGILLGLAWGLVPLKGFLGIALFFCVNTVLVYGYTSSFQKVDDEEYGGVWELVKEGFVTSFAGFLTTIVKYLKEINDAQEANVRVAQEEEEVKKRVASGKFRQKGIHELKIRQPNQTTQSAET
ncbi:hypothetical protein HPB49_009352 [Dermacentor silvarum]|uniref:Uncharacterized protein n=1 Tax=Dermacentor silvarum TaxID=543639 RepID=A0ACB8DYQ3_DERSI|nr:hypothetical protein HPB49_009352 [Dermacentor silvarum]